MDRLHKSQGAWKQARSRLSTYVSTEMTKKKQLGSKKIQFVWNGWRKVVGVISDKRVSARTKEKVNKTVVRPAMLYGMETVPLAKKIGSRNLC